ncbi:MAG TPA: RHS repeat-associated core domain-containing protein, partial [Allosphingosinicella sp.]
LYAPRFGYTGLRYFSSLRISYARNRMLHHEGARFLQSDPIGYGDGMNMYAYVGGDRVNGVDPARRNTMILGFGRCEVINAAAPACG